MGDPDSGPGEGTIAYGGEVDDFWGKKSAEGLCTEPKWFWAPTGENLWFIEGEYDALLGILATPESQKLLVNVSIHGRA